MSTKVAVIQKPPVLLDRGKTIARSLESIGVQTYVAFRINSRSLLRTIAGESVTG